MRVDQTTCVTIEARLPPLCRRSSGRAGSFLAKHTLDPQPGATGRPRNRDGQSVVQRQPQRSSWTRNRTTRPESGEPRWMVPRHTVDAHRNQYPEKPGSWLRRIQVAITAGHRGNRGNASAGKHGDHQARAARAGVVDKLGSRRAHREARCILAVRLRFGPKTPQQHRPRRRVRGHRRRHLRRSAGVTMLEATRFPTARDRHRGTGIDAHRLRTRRNPKHPRTA